MVGTQTRTNPFPGLRPFEPDEDHLFFGREGQTDELLRRLKRTRFLAIVGTSGSGKSSLVRAGLLPALYSGFMTRAGSSWRVAVLRPGNDPIANLAVALNQPEVLGGEDADRLHSVITDSTLRRGALGLVEVVQQARMSVDENLLVVVDQFEELFRFKQSEAAGRETGDEAAAFVKLLLEATRHPDVPIYAVLTMRSDFLGDCAQFRDLPEAINDSQYLIPRLTREQQRQAIVSPVAVGQAEIAPRLVNRLLNDVGDNPDQLPILQHALMRTWDNWVSDHAPGEPIDLRHYEAIGGMERALSQHADEIYQPLDSRDQKITEKLFKCLTEKASDGRGIRRPTRLGDICAVAGATTAEVVEVVEQFRAPGRSFLMPPVGVALHDDTVLDISHESLMRVWQQMKDWVEEEGQSAQIYRRLAETATMQQAGRAGLYHDPELTIALNWRDQTQPNAAWAKRYNPAFDQAMQFLEASVAARDAAVVEKETARQKEINRLRGFSAIVAFLFVLALGTAAFAFQQQKIAAQQRQEAEEQRQDAEEQRGIAEEQRTIATEQRDTARLREQEAEDAKELALRREREAQAARRTEAKQRQQAETARRSEAQQRTVAVAAQRRAELGEAEARRQTGIATEQRTIAQQREQDAIEAGARADRQRVNAEVTAQSYAAENLLASNLDLEALVTGVKVGQRVNELADSLNADTQTRVCI
jgi:energy-coupling factor transporter ATP-binding protein EcfA2